MLGEVGNLASIEEIGENYGLIRATLPLVQKIGVIYGPIFSILAKKQPLLRVSLPIGPQNSPIKVKIFEILKIRPFFTLIYSIHKPQCSETPR
ncbi:hypothetical protein ACFQ3W_04480 [Paenibacillus puldeungensis]|uniref:Uncharacterized protein n=1 Tax=Paenibacillus puldeungensis TaxID=696536 RepID=A0ABW3RTZ0_9BACL